MTDQKIVFKKKRNDDNDQEYTGSQCFQIGPNVKEREIPTNGEEYLLKVMKERAKCATVTRCNLDVLSKFNEKCNGNIIMVTQFNFSYINYFIQFFF